MKVSGDLGVGAAYGVAVTKQAMNTSQQLAKEAIKLIDKSASSPSPQQPGLGQNLDIKA